MDGFQLHFAPFRNRWCLMIPLLPTNVRRILVRSFQSSAGPPKGRFSPLGPAVRPPEKGVPSHQFAWRLTFGKSWFGPSSFCTPERQPVGGATSRSRTFGGDPRNSIPPFASSAAVSSPPKKDTPRFGYGSKLNHQDMDRRF